MPDGIRVARTDEYVALGAIEAAADSRFADIGIGPFAPTAGDGRLAESAVVLVSGEPVVGFACVDVVDGTAHLWQLSVHPSGGRQGHGRALVEAVCAWATAQGLSAVTLTTFRDVAWNGPLYTKLGFRELTYLTPGLAAIREHERSIGDDDFGPRIAMIRDLP